MSDLLDDAVGALRGWLLWWWPTSAHGDVPAPEEFRLRDGTRVWIRPILPSDRELHAVNYERLSADSKFHRFLTPMTHLSEEMLTRLVDDVDGVDHVAYYVFGDSDDPEVSMLPIAIGRIKRDPERPDTADVAVTVMDPWHGRGVATALLPVLVARRPEGVTGIVTAVATDNPASIAMLKRLGPTEVIPMGGGALEVRIDLSGSPRVPVPPAVPQPVPAAVADAPAALDELLPTPAAALAPAALAFFGLTAVVPWRAALRAQDATMPWWRPAVEVITPSRHPDDTERANP